MRQSLQYFANDIGASTLDALVVDYSDHDVTQPTGFRAGLAERLPFPRQGRQNLD
jgi:hypothetical protein